MIKRDFLFLLHEYTTSCLLQEENSRDSYRVECSLPFGWEVYAAAQFLTIYAKCAKRECGFVNGSD